jgi:hypothetical protein
MSVTISDIIIINDEEFIGYELVVIDNKNNFISTDIKIMKNRVPKSCFFIVELTLHSPKDNKVLIGLGHKMTNDYQEYEKKRYNKLQDIRNLLIGKRITNYFSDELTYENDDFYAEYMKSYLSREYRIQFSLIIGLFNKPMQWHQIIRNN